MPDSRNRKIRTDAVIATAGMLVLLGLMLGILWVGRPAQPESGLRLTSPGGIVVGTLGAAVLVGWWCYWGLRIIRTMDEYKQHIERASWFWGGILGLMTSVPVYTFIMFGGLQWLNFRGPAGPGVANAFAQGYMLPIFMQVAGAMIVALWMRVSRR